MLESAAFPAVTPNNLGPRSDTCDLVGSKSDGVDWADSFLADIVAFWMLVVLDVVVFVSVVLASSSILTIMSESRYGDRVPMLATITSVPFSQRIATTAFAVGSSLDDDASIAASTTCSRPFGAKTVGGKSRYRFFSATLLSFDNDDCHGANEKTQVHGGTKDKMTSTNGTIRIGVVLDVIVGLVQRHVADKICDDWIV